MRRRSGRTSVTKNGTSAMVMFCGRTAHAKPMARPSAKTRHNVTSSRNRNESRTTPPQTAALSACDIDACLREYQASGEPNQIAITAAAAIWSPK